MDIYDSIRREHAKMLDTLRKLEDTAAHQPGARKALLRQVGSHFRVQKKIAEDRLYPLLLASPKTYAAVGRSREDNKEIDTLLAQLAGVGMSDPGTGPLLENLSSLLRRWVEWEERELFRQARSVISPEQAALLGEAAAGEQVELYHRFLES